MALPAPIVTIAVTGVAGVAPFPTVPAPRVIVSVPVEAPVTASAVAADSGVPMDVVIVGAGVPALFMVTNTCAC